MIKEIKTQEELEEHQLFLRNNPYSPNKIKYKNNVYVYSSEQLYDLRTHSKNLIEDYFHPDYWIFVGYGYKLVSNVSIREGRGRFTRKDDSTWVSVNPADVVRVETADHQLFESEGKFIMTQRHLSTPLRVHMSDDMLVSLGFVKGKFAKDFYFYKSEVDSLDTYLPYQKFENTYYKVDVKSLQIRMKEDGHNKEAIIEAVNKAMKDNLLYGVDTLTYSAFEGIGYTFGIEIETCIGRLNKSDFIDKLNVKAVHDGSLRDADGATPGGEYVTGVLIGDSGLYQLHELCRILSMRCKVNAQCGRVYATLQSNL